MVFADGPVTAEQLLRMIDAHDECEIEAPMFYCVHCNRLVPLVYEAVRRHVMEECRGDH